MPDRFIPQGSPEEQLTDAELSVEQIYVRVLEKLPEVVNKIIKKRTFEQKKRAS